MDNDLDIDFKLVITELEYSFDRTRTGFVSTDRLKTYLLKHVLNTITDEIMISMFKQVGTIIDDDDNEIIDYKKFTRMILDFSKK